MLDLISKYVEADIESVSDLIKSDTGFDIRSDIVSDIVSDIRSDSIG